MILMSFSKNVFIFTIRDTERLRLSLISNWCCSEKGDEWGECAMQLLCSVSFAPYCCLDTCPFYRLTIFQTYQITGLTSPQVSGMQDLYWSLMFSPAWPVCSLNLLLSGLINVLLPIRITSFPFVPEMWLYYYNAPISQPDNRLTDGQARCCQAEYSYKFNEHPDSREFVSLLTLHTLAD